MNKIYVYGRLTRDVELKEVSGRNCASFGVAAQNKHKNKDTGNYDSNFYTVTAWGQAADIASRYLKKGQRVTVAGDLVIRDYIGTDNQKHTVVEINNAELDLVETAAHEADLSATGYWTGAESVERNASLVLIGVELVVLRTGDCREQQCAEGCQNI